LFMLYPEGVKCQDWDGLLPLHDASREAQYDAAFKLIQLYPQGLRTANIRGELPLLAAVRKGCMDLVSLMIYCFPESGKIILGNLYQYDDVEQWDWDILELCLRGAVGKLDGCIYTYYECSKLEGKSKKRRYPSISCPASKQARVSRVTRCNIKKMDVAHSGIMCCDNCSNDLPCQKGTNCPSKFLALHAAIECEASVTVLYCILKDHAHQAFEVDNDGMLPLHIAAAHANSPHAQTVLQKIIDLNPNAAYKRDFRERLPLHIALSNGFGYQAIKLLFDANKAAAFVTCQSKDKFSGTYPLFMATSCDCELDVVFLLLVGDPGILGL